MSQLRRLLRAPNCVSQITAREYVVKAARKRDVQRKPSDGLFPEKFFNKKMKTPENLYLGNEETADVIDKATAPYLKQINCNTALEINPGVGYLTKKLLDQEEKFRKIILIETNSHFMPKLNELHSIYPDRVKVKHGDFIGLWKLAFQDKQDKGMRLAELLEDVPKHDASNNATNMVIFGSIGSYNFFKHLINSVVFQTSLLSLGHSEMFLVIPPPIYIHLTCSNEIGYMIYRSTSILFQMLFEYRFITQIPREHFLPTQVQFNPSKYSKLLRVKSVNPEYLYLVKIAPRRNILDLCPAEDLPALWYFVKQNCISRRNRVIPNLEKYITGCGPRLIINKKNPIPAKVMFEDENPLHLPKYSNQCTTMSCRDYYPNMNIYTQFGDLSASQMLTLFREFRQWPEYGESSFLASLENSLLKLETSEGETIDGIDIVEEDDVTGSDLTLSPIDTKDSSYAKKSAEKSTSKEKLNIPRRTE